MAGSHDGRVCLCDRADGTCAGLAVRRLSPARVQDLAEEIWTASSGDLLPARPAADPRSSRAGASAQAAYLRRREQERKSWGLDWAWWSLAVIGAALAGATLVGATVGSWLAMPAALLLAAWTGQRLRFRLSLEATTCRRLAATQRRTAALLAPLADEGWQVLHDVTLPGWLDSLEHLAVGPNGVWVVASWQRPRRLLGGTVPVEVLHGLRSQAEGVAEVLDGWAQVPVRALLCRHGAWSGTGQMLHDVLVTAPRQLTDAIQGRGAPLPPGELEGTTTRLLQVLRPAA